MNFTNITLGSRDHFHLESTLLPMIVYCTRRFWWYSMMFSRDFVPSLLQFPCIDKPLWITTYTCHSYLHPQLLLLLQDALKCSPMFRESLMLTALQFLFRTNTCMDNSSQLPGIHSSPVVHMFRKILHNTIRPFEDPQQPIALEFPACFHYD